MAKELENKAKEAFFDDDFALAVDFYSQAIQFDPTNANLFADRAQAHIKLNAFTGPENPFFVSSFLFLINSLTNLFIFCRSCCRC